MPTKSQLHLYSLGILAANKPLRAADGSYNEEIEVVPIEVSMMVDGQLTDDKTTLSAAAQDSSGAAYSVEVDTSNSIKATWMSSGRGNRLTAPDLRRGDTVEIWRFADTDKFYWKEYGDMNKRRLETVVTRFSATKDENATLGPDNSYHVEISTHEKQLTLHTSQANDEFCGFDIQLNTDQGFLQIQDTVGNSFTFNSSENQIEMLTADGGHFNLISKSLYIDGLDLMAFNAKKMTFNGDELDTTVTTVNTQASTITTKTDTNNLTATNNNITATTSHTGTYGITGKLNVSSKATFSGGLAVGGSISSLGSGFDFSGGGQLTVDSITSTGNVNAPNIS